VNFRFSIFQFNYNPSALPLPDGGQALAVRAQCGSADCARTWLGPNIDVVAISRQISASPLTFAPITNSSIILQPTVFSGLSDEKCGVQDPRVTFDPATKTYYMTYTCWDCKTYNLCMAVCSGDPEDAGCWEHRGRMFPNNLTKSGSLLVMPKPPHYMFYGCFPPMLATTMDFKTWTQRPGALLPQRPGSWDAGMETGPMPMKLSDGNYLFIFNGVCTPGKPGCSPLSEVNTSVQYAPGWAILNGTDPSQVLTDGSGALIRAKTPLLTPRESWELGTGDWEWEKTKGVVFAEGWRRLGPDSFMLFYGGADTVVGAATVTVRISKTLKSDDANGADTQIVGHATQQQPPLLSSVFFSLYGPCLNFTVDDWRTELQLLRNIGISSIILKNVAHGDSDILHDGILATAAYPSALPWLRESGTDVLGKLLTACDLDGGFEVSIGIFEDSAFFNHHKTATWLSEYAARNIAVMKEVVALYRSKHPSFHSIYDSAEVNDRDWNSSVADNLIDHYLQPVHSWAHKAGLATSTAPFFFNSSKPAVSAIFWDQLFSRVHINRVYLDDDAATSFWTVDGPIPFYRAFGPVAAKHNVSVWSDCVDHGHANKPQPIGHLLAQMRVEAPFVRGFTSFEYLRYMSPGTGAYEGSAELYHGYQAYFNASEPLPGIDSQLPQKSTATTFDER
jgi:predicted GH43/DUF377 family glycosyl hydrolase